MTVAGAAEEGLLRRFEPVLRYTDGELFFPTAVESFVRECSLWEHAAGGAHCRVPRGEVDLERLVAEGRVGGELSLRFVDSPLSRRELRAWRRRPDRPRSRPAGRFAEVGLTARFVDVLFRAGLLLRGRVPGGLVAAADVISRTRLDPAQHPYYGRVVRDGGYVVLQYWFFYAMNDWRSTFGGANDHEGDWEQVTIYLAEEPDGSLVPAWAACSAHDEVGDDLRRRWDDPELTRHGDHVVVHPGAGSHSGAFLRGDYLTAVRPRGFGKTLLRMVRSVVKVVAPWAQGDVSRGVGIPFVDYSRGDGVTIGPGSTRPWSPIVIDDSTPWVRDFRGLWGLDTEDRFGGERAPAGPRFERGGAIRQAWSDPLGWAGLHKVPASQAEATRLLEGRLDAIDAELDALDIEVERQRVELREATTAARYGSGPPASRTAEAALVDLVDRRTALADERLVLRRDIHRPAPDPGPQAHLRRPAVPIGARPDSRSRFLRVWSTVSTPLLLAAVAYLLFDQDLAVVRGVAMFVVLFLALESVARGEFVRFATSLVVVVAVGLVAVAALRGVLDNTTIVLGVIVGVAAVVSLVVNVRDLRR